jgi:glycosyltransferase involved in cell wall biosynthesis
VTALNILHITPYYAPAWAYGGVVSAVTGLTAAQATRGHHVTVLTTDALGPVERSMIQHEQIDDVQVVRCRNLSNSIRWRYNISQPVGFRHEFRKLAQTADVIHTHELRTVENLLLVHTKPVVLSPHGTLSHRTGRGAVKRIWDTVFGRTLLRRIDHIAALTENEADEARALWTELGIPFPGASMIPNGVSEDFAVAGDLRPRYALGGGPVVLFLGRLHERKGLQFLIPAFAKATQNIPDARLLVVGPDEGMLSTAMALVEELGIAERVIFTGLLQGADQRAALVTADIFVLPAVGEGLSMAALEAMASELPVILTPGCNLPDVETHGAGLLVKRDVESVAAALQTLLNNVGLRKKMGQKGRAWVMEKYTWPTIAAQTDELYTKLVPQ